MYIHFNELLKDLNGLMKKDHSMKIKTMPVFCVYFVAENDDKSSLAFV